MLAHEPSCHLVINTHKETHTLTHLFLSMEAQLQQLRVRRQQFLNKSHRQLCVDLVHYLKANAESKITFEKLFEKEV